MTFLVKYWKESLIVILVGFVAFGYWLNVKTSQEVGKLETQIELQKKQDKREKKIEEAISNSTGSVDDELQFLRDRKRSN